MTLRHALRHLLAAALSTAAVAAAETTYLPGAAEVTGLAGARFSSTLEIANPGATAASVTIGLVPMEGAAAPAPVARTLAAGESLRVNAALKTLFGLGDRAAGTITVTSDALLVSSLTTQNVAAAEGAYGLGLLPVAQGDLLGAGETGHSIWVSQSADPSAGYRTNLSVTLAEAGTVVEVRVLDAAGHVAGTATVSGASPFVWQRPVKELAGEADLPIARAEFEVKAGRATAYAVVNDNVTSDAIALQAERVVPGALDRLVSGAALSPGLLGAYWVTDLRLFNPGSEAVTATLRSVGASREASTTVTVPAKGVVEVARVLEALGLPERTACALRVTAAQPILVAARTNNIDPSGVRRGTFSAQQFVTNWPAGLLSAGATGFFPGVDQTLNVPGVRTNLTLVGGPEGAKGELILRNATGAEQARTPFARGAGEWGQLSVADWFGASAGVTGALAATTIPENARVDVAVSTGALDAFVSRIDNGSGDAVTRPFALPGGGDCSKVAITAFGAAPQPIRTATPTTFSWSVSLDPPSAELTTQSIRFDGEPEIELDKSARTYTRSFAAAGTRSATLTVRKGSCVKTRALTFFVCSELSVEPTTLPNGVAFTAYPARTLTMPGATPPATWAVVAGALPKGLALSAAGELAGEPTEVGTFTFTVRGTDANGCSGTRAYTLSVTCPTLRIAPSTLPSGTVGVPWPSVRMSVSGGSGAGTWSATNLPPGLVLSPSGNLTGTPTTAGSYAVTIRYTDDSGCIGTAPYTILVCNTLVVTPNSVAAATSGVAYGPVPFSVTGASGAATWAVTAGGLPAGLALDPATGVLSGTPTVVGSFPFTVTATDTLGCKGSVAVTLVVNCPTIAVSPASLAGGTAGVAYATATLTQTGAVGAVTWSVTSGALPAGMSLSPAGVLSGTPTVVGTFPFTATATDANGCTGSRPYSLTIACPTITLGALVPSTGTAGVAYSATLGQTGGVGTVTYAVTGGALPAGLALLPNGTLSGTPLVTGPFTFTVTATDANGCTGTQGYTLTIACPTIVVSPASVAAGTAGVAYAPVTFTQAGGVGTIAWSVIGTLPNGLSLDPSTGVLSGTPLQTGSFPVTIRATDANGCIGDRAVVLTIACPTITVGPATVPSGIAGVAYAGATFTQAGGVGTIGWSVSLGVLPNGLTLDPTSGALTGTPLQTGSFPVTVRATDANGCTGDRAVTVTVLCPTITVVAGGPLGGVEGTAITPVGFSQTGGVGGVTWTSSGTLPNGLTFSTTGVLSGTPAAGSAGSYTVTFIATDANGCTGSLQVTFRICPVVAVGPNPIAAFLQGLTYAETLVGSGGAGPYAFAVSAGTLPAGITLDGATGALSGNPTTLQAYDFTITATDANGCTGTRRYTGRVCPVITVSPAVSNLPNGVVGTAYGQSLSAAGSPDLPYVFTVTGGALPDGVTLSGNLLSGVPTTAGTFTFTITATDANGCTGSRTYTVEVCVAPSITPTPAAVCALSTGNTASGPAGATSYAWSIANGTITSGGASQTVTYTAGAFGNVTLTLTVTSASSCTASTSVDVPVNPVPSAAITAPTAVCAGSTGNAASVPDAGPGATYAWGITNGTITGGAGTASITFTAGPTGPVQLNVTVTSAAGCSATGNASVTVNPVPSAAITAPTAVCAGSTGNAASVPDAGPGATYAWGITNGTITGGAGTASITFTAGPAGPVQLNVTVTSAAGCSSNGNASVTLNPVPSAAITAPTAVCADSTGNAASVPDAGPGATYAWGITNGTITGGAGTASIAFTAGPTGPVQLSVTVTSAAGCSSSGNANVTVNPTPSATITAPAAACASSTGNVASVPSAGAGATYAWGITNGTITAGAGTASVTFTAGTAGTTQLTVTVTTAAGCSSNGGTSVTVNPVPSASVAAPSAVCAGSTGNVASVPDAGPGATYTWGITGGTITGGAGTSSIVFTAGASGTVALTVTVQTAAGCSASGGASPTISAIPTLSPAAGALAAATYNAAYSQSFTASGGAAPFAYAISPATPPAGLAFNTTSGLLSGTPNATGTFSFTVTATNAAGCVSATQSYTLAVRPNLVADGYSGLGNTQFYVTGVSGAPTTPAISSGTTALANDTPTGAVGIVPATVTCSPLGGSMTIDALGRFVYTPAAGAIGADACAYTASSDTGGTGTPAAATGTVTVTLSNRVWYVKNDAPGGGLGRSNDPFDTLPEAETASSANDILFVYRGSTGTTPIPNGITLKDGQKLWGEGIGLTVAGFGTLVPAGQQPRISNGSGDAVSVPATAGNRQNVEVRGLDLTGSVNAVDVTATGTNVVGVTISDNTVSGAGAEGIDLNAGSTGAFAATVSTNTISSTGNGVDARTGAATTMTLDLSNLTVTSNATGILVDGSVGGGTTTITGFANNVVSGNTLGTGISVNTAKFDATPGGTYQTVSGGSTAVGVSGNGVGANGVVLTNVSGDLAFTDLDVFADSGAGLRASGTAVYTGSAGLRIVVGAGVGTVEATGGPAIDVTQATLTLPLSSLRSTNSATTGVALNSVLGTVSAGSGSSISGVTSAAGTSFQVGSSNATVSYAGTISTTTGKGVDLTSNTGSTISFTGTLTLSSLMNTAFNATGGGTVTATDTASTLTSTTGTTLNVANTTIGAAGLKFRSISTNGAASGIVLDTTGASGSLAVLGNGGSCTSAGTCTGGAIVNTTGAGVSLTSTLSPSFDRVFVQNTGASGVRGTGVTNFTLTNSRIENSGTAAGGQYVESNVAFNDAGAFTTAVLTGTVTITGNTLLNARRHGIQIENGSGTISNLLIQNNTLTSSTSAASSLGTAILVLQQGSAASTSHLTTGTISGNTITNFPSGEGIAILGGSGNSANNTSATLGANGTPISITGNFIVGQPAAAQHLGSNAIRASFNGQVGVSNFSITSNGTAGSPITNIQGQGISVFMGGTVTGTTTISNNFIVANQTLGAGTHGMAVQVDDGPAGSGTSAADYNFVITNNSVSNYEGNGIRAIARASLGKMDVTIQNNTVGAPSLANRNGIRVDSGSAAGDVTVCMLMSGNTSAGSGVNQGIGIRKQGTIATTNDFGISGLAPSPTTGANAAAYVASQNPAGGGVDALSGDNFVNCTPTP